MHWFQENRALSCSISVGEEWGPPELLKVLSLLDRNQVIILGPDLFRYKCSFGQQYSRINTSVTTSCVYSRI